MEMIRVLDIPVHCLDMAQAVARIESMLTESGLKCIMAVNPEKIIASRNNTELRSALESCDMLIPDGIGAVVGARMLGAKSIKRVAGADLMPNICAHAARNRLSIFVFGAAPGVADAAAANLKHLYPALMIAGTASGYFAPGEDRDIIERINQSGAQILFVGLGSPAQELWIQKNRSLLDVRLIQAVGGTIDVLAGRVARAPAILRAIHLEWLHRLVRQPSRALRQKALPQFAAALLRAKFNAWIRTPQ
jgi:N-acetylglucosaminyldiphosphoundecaprenol N-acetyl-beta-D-mannosaminyltransferase